MISIRLFGKLSVLGPDGTPIPVAGTKTQGLVAYLALNIGMPPTRDRLMGLFWGDRFTDQARQSLRQAIAKIKRTLADGGENIIVATHDQVGFNPDLVTVDADQFAAIAADPSHDATNTAVTLLQGQLLDGLFGQQAEFDDWLASERQRFTTLSLSVLERAAEHCLRQGDTGQAAILARRIVASDPLRDAGQIVLIRILAQQGERAAAIQQFNAYVETLKTELDVGPGAELLQLINEVKGQTAVSGQTTPTLAVAPPPDEGATEKASIAVMPFGELGDNPNGAFLAAGLSEDITTHLSRFSWLDVKSGNRTGETPGNWADYLVHGSLRSQGDKIRLSVQLAEPETGRYIWASRYDRAGADLFLLQDELSDTIAASLEAELERLAGRRMREMALEDMNAWECYHRGLALQYEFSAKTNLSTQRHFQRAIELDPNFALAYARLSYAMVISTIYFEAADVNSVLTQALDYANTAARLEPDDAVVRFALGRVRLALGEYDRSITDLKAAIELNPGMAQAHCGLGDSMAYSGQLDDAIACFEEAVRISPSDPYRWAFLSYGATAFLFKGDYQSAITWASEAEAVPNSHYWPTAIRASALAHLGEKDQALAAVSDLKRQRPGISLDFVRERLFYLRDPEQVEIYVSGLDKAGLA